MRRESLRARLTTTLSVDDKVLARARAIAAARGKSLNQLIRDELARLTGAEHRQADWREIESLSGTGHSRGWHFNRDELHERT